MVDSVSASDVDSVGPFTDFLNRKEVSTICVNRPASMPFPERKSMRSNSGDTGGQKGLKGNHHDLYSRICVVPLSHVKKVLA